MKELRASDLVFSASRALHGAATRWGDDIPLMILADISSACLAIASERLDDAARLLAEVEQQINKP